MGAWGIKNFENDAAADFTWDILEKGKKLIKSSLVKVVESQEDTYLDADDGEMALTAAEFVAAGKGNPSSDFPKEALDWVSKNDVLNYRNRIFAKKNDVTEIAIKAVERVLGNSELKELWEEADEFDKWKEIQDDLIDRLRK